MVDDKVIERAWNLINGDLDLENFPECGSDIIKDEFEEGSECDKLYGDAYDIRCRLVDEINTPEADRDLN